MNRTILISILLTTCLLVGCENEKEINNGNKDEKTQSFHTYAFENSDWQQCPQVNALEEMSQDGIDNFEINSKIELKIFVSSIVHSFTPFPMPKNDNSQWGKTVPIILEPNQNCDGIVFTSVQTKTSDLTEEELNALRIIHEGMGNIGNARDICSLKIMGWMKDYGYTVRHLIVSEKDELISDAIYDYDLCSNFIRIDNYQ